MSDPKLDELYRRIVGSGAVDPMEHVREIMAAGVVKVAAGGSGGGGPDLGPDPHAGDPAAIVNAALLAAPFNLVQGQGQIYSQPRTLAGYPSGGNMAVSLPAATGMPGFGQTQPWPNSSVVQVPETLPESPNAVDQSRWVLDHIARQEAGPVMGPVGTQSPFEPTMPGGPFNQMPAGGVNAYESGIYAYPGVELLPGFTPGEPPRSLDHRLSLLTSDDCRCIAIRVGYYEEWSFLDAQGNWTGPGPFYNPPIEKRNGNFHHGLNWLERGDATIRVLRRRWSPFVDFEFLGLDQDGLLSNAPYLDPGSAQHPIGATQADVKRTYMMWICCDGKILRVLTWYWRILVQLDPLTSRIIGWRLLDPGSIEQHSAESDPVNNFWPSAEATAWCIAHCFVFG